MPNYPYTFQLPPLNVQDIPNDGVAGEFLGINGSGVLDWLTAGGGGTGDMLKSENLSGLASYPTARTNLGLGTGDSPTFANLTLTSPSLVSSAPVTISQTWNNAAVTFTGLKVNAAGTSGTNSASASLLADFQVNGVSKVSVDKSGIITLPQTGGDAAGLICGGSAITNAATYIGIYGIRLDSTSSINWASGKNLNVLDTILLRDGAANTLALRNGANTQTFNVYGSYGSISDYKRLSISCDQTTGNATITNQAAGYTAGTVSINGVPVGLGKGNVSSNVAVGTGALSTNATGADNVAVGFEALGLGTAGSESVAVGWRAAKGSSVRHVSIGYGANQLGATDSVSIGWASMFSLAGGSLNVAVGRSSGYFITGGSTHLTSCTKSLFLGCDTKALGQSQENQIVIGYDATGIGSHSVVLGNDSITKTALKGNVGIGTTSPTSKLHVAETWNGSVINVTGASGASGTATITFATQAEAIPVGTTVVIASVNPSGYNGTAVVTASSVTSVSYANATTATYVSGGTVQRQFTAVKVNVTDTASHTSSNLLDLQVGGVSKASFNKDGVLAMGVNGAATMADGSNGFLFKGAGVSGLYVGQNGSGQGAVVVPAGGLLGFSNAGTPTGSSLDTILLRDAANTLALRNGAAAQTFRVYNTYTDASNYERAIFSWNSNRLEISTGQAGSGVSRKIDFGTNGATAITFFTNTVNRWAVASDGHFIAAADNAYDIGASGANRPRNVYVASQLVVGTFATFGSFIYAENYYFSTTKGLLAAPSDGVFTFSNRAATDFTRLQFGGTTNLFPAIKRSTTTLQARLADDSAFAPIQGKLTTDTAYTATVVTATGYITIYDSTGAAYRVPCAV